ncbi:hypothetical protein A3SI_02351 [Nitritalea halalkaliphila LW7]|uniref:Uncharacterized protein n=1 Tax=Nitritalea halalkaliphila LW7 TaxID=1189621 RepID=I5C9R4_9BACT|nr:hypothetical protein [Nitritalea halalkaliphila]EIM78566.1 hypothetical protein A3SI_02351 [Nitritalea halalkaliphila LW7]
MKYKLKIEHAQDKSGSIDLQRLVTIAESLRKISEGALQLRLKGLSKAKKTIKLNEALKVSLTGIQEGSTILCLESEKFEKTLPGYQTDFFMLEHQQELPQKTPITLFVESFEEALTNAEESELLDKPLLKELFKFKKSFLKDDEVFSIQNEGSFQNLTLKKSDFRKIQIAEEEIPQPESAVINGIIEELTYSKLKVKIQTNEGIVEGFLSESVNPEEIKTWWGKEATITGTLHYKSGKRTVFEIERIFESQPGDEFFSKKQRHESLEEQIQRQLQEGKQNNPLRMLVGTWPGEETDEEFEAMLNNLD